MANITTTGTTGYPGAIDTRTSLTDGAAGDSIVSNHPNGLGAGLIAVETTLGVNPQGSVADVVTRLDVSQNSNGTIRSSVIAAGPGSDVSYSSGIFTISGTPEGPGAMQNVAVEITPNRGVANQLGIRLVQRDGSTPTATSPSRISFHAATSTSPSYQIATATANTELLLSSGSTLGFLANQRGRIYIHAILATPTIELAVSRKAMFQEMLLQNTTAEGGAGGADDDGTLYSATARSSVPIRTLAYIDIQTGGTAGQWATAPFFGSLVGPGSKRTGDVIQVVATLTSTSSSGTTTIPQDTSTPQISEGDQYLSLPITPSSEVNLLDIDGQLVLSNGNSVRTMMTLFYASNTNAIAVVQGNAAGNDDAITHHIKLATISGRASSITFSLRGGSNVAGTTRLGAISSASPLYGGFCNNYIIIKEIMV